MTRPFTNTPGIGIAAELAAARTELADIRTRSAITQARLQSMAETLAVQIDTLDGLTPDQRCDLRKLPVALAALCDLLHGDRAGDVIAFPRKPMVPA